MHVQLKNIGPIKDADIRFGDLTVFVGPQASGKSIALQFLKLVLDNGLLSPHASRVTRTRDALCAGLLYRLSERRFIVPLVVGFTIASE
jgi:predicted ATPase